MKPTTTTLPGKSSPVEWTTKKSIWAMIATVLNRMPLGITPCRSEKEAKTYTLLLVVFILAFLLAGLYDSILIKEGGGL